ncbi:hypothetical protein [Georgenia sp. H159]|uniref:hypothetical protein n=1 Tax=Georgenia sp. H159 TaxID=3076115 RepID=UPI002D775A14|nr:hypothetical protein [Georgenia sp. H159]
MGADDVTPEPEELLAAAEGSVEVELARALSAAQRQIHWLREERDRLRAELLDEGAELPDEPVGDASRSLDSVVERAVPEAARRLALREAAGTDTWERLTEDVRQMYLSRARAAVDAVVPLFDAAIAAIPGLGEVRRAQLRLGLPPEGDLVGLLDHVRAESRARAVQEVSEELSARMSDYELTRRAVQAVELVVVEGEHMANQHSSPVAVEVAEWFTRRLQQALAEPDVTLGDALQAEREQVLLAVAAELGLTGMDALAWYSEMSNRLDAADPDPAP